MPFANLLGFGSQGGDDVPPNYRKVNFSVTA